MVASLAAIPAMAFGQDARAPAGSVTIISPKQAVEAALALSPALRGAGAAQQAARSDALQARLRPNPELRGTFENFGGVGGRGDYRGGRALETTIGIAQRIEC
ncbi:hypothetical protein CR165_21610 [Pseudoroseomonas aestuarii]|uniref:Transporter n=1 Tax=Teichococcus aestuarii TaxID=568898 RepID=A0A2U1UYM8_9PROT|nr:hypothetical protein CR165_21610 [Pseudoroseomonas aestuarii]